MSRESGSSRINILMIRDVIMNHSNENHKLLQKDILRLIEEDYGTKMSPRTLQRHLPDLIDYDNNIEYEGRIRIDQDGDEKMEYTNLYYLHPFSNMEMLLLYDTIIKSRNITTERKRKFVERVALLGGVDAYRTSCWASKVSVDYAGTEKESNKAFYTSLETISNAIGEKKCISFDLCEYKWDFEANNLALMPKEKFRQFTPYKLFIKDGQYFLAGISEKKIKLLDSFRKRIAEGKTIIPQAPDKNPIQCYNVSKLSNIQIQEDSKKLYYNLNDTRAQNKTLSDYLEATISTYTNTISFREHSGRIELIISDETLDYIMENFIDKAKILPYKADDKLLKRIQATYKRYNNENCKSLNLYKVIIDNYAEYDFHLLLNYSMKMHKYEKICLIISPWYLIAHMKGALDTYQEETKAIRGLFKTPVIKR